MRYLPIILLTLALSGACGYFQYWMDTRLGKKRWLLLLQPVLLAVITGCFAGWTLSLPSLKGNPARLMWAPFAAALACTLAGWGAGEWRRKKP